MTAVNVKIHSYKRRNERNYRLNEIANDEFNYIQILDKNILKKILCKCSRQNTIIYKKYIITHAKKGCSQSTITWRSSA